MIFKKKEKGPPKKSRGEWEKGGGRKGGGGLQAHGMKMGGIDNDCHESDSCLFPFFYLFCISRRHSALLSRRMDEAKRLATDDSDINKPTLLSQLQTLCWETVIYFFLVPNTF